MAAPVSPSAQQFDRLADGTPRAAPLSGLRLRLFANIRAHGVARLGEIAVGALLLPYVIGHLGRESYGFWAWLLVVTGYISLADFGLAQGNVRSLAHAIAEGDRGAVAKLLTSAMVLHAALMITIAGLVSLAFRASAGASAANPKAHPFLCLGLLIAAQGVTVAGFPFGSLISAMQRLDLIHKIRISQFTLQAAGTVWILARGGGVLALCGLQLGLAIFQTAQRSLITVRLVPGLRPRRPRSREILAGARVGAPLVLLSVHVAVIVSFERALLGFLVDFASLAQYAVAARLVMIGVELPQVIVFSAIPATAALDVLGREAALDRLYARAFKITAAIVLPTIAMLWVTAPAILHAWLGDGFEVAATIARPLAAGFLLPTLTAPAVNVLIGRSRLGRAAMLLVAWSVAFLAVNTGWLWLVGFSGAGWGTLVVNALGTACFLRWFHARELGGARSLAPLLARIAAGSLLGMVLGEAATWILRSSPSRGADLATAVIASAALWIGYLGWAWLSGLVDGEDRALVAEALRPLGQR